MKTEVIISGRDDSKRAFDSVAGSLRALDSRTASLGNVVGALGVSLSAASFTSFLKGGIDTLDMLGDLHDRTGIAASTLAGFQLVAAQSDTSLAALGKGVNKLSIFMAEYADAAKKLGLTATDPAEAFVQLSTILMNIEDVQKRNAVANKILGKSYQELLPALLQGGTALEKQIEAGRAYAGVTEEMVKQAQQFNDEIDQLKTEVGYASASFASGLLPSMSDTTQEMRRMREEGNNVMAVLRGIAGIGKIPFDFFFPDKPFTTTDHIKELNDELQSLQKDAFNVKGGGLLYQWLAGGSEAEINKKIKIVENQLAAYTKFKDQLEKPAIISEPVKPKADNPIIDAFIAPDKKPKAGRKDPAIDEARRFIEQLQKEVSTLDLSKSAILAYDAAHLKLNATQKQTVASLINVISTREQLAKDNEAWAEQEKLNAQFDEEQLRQLEEASATEIALNDARSQSFADMTDAILRENEDLNISLITSDKKRAQAQAAAEHARAMQRIESMIGEAEEVQAAIDAETDHYQLQLKKIDQEMHKTKSISEELGATFKSAAEEAIVQWDGFGNVMKGIEEDIIRLAARKTMLDPLLGAFDKLLSGDGGDSGGGNIFGSIWDRVSSFLFNAKGGVYDSPSLSTYSNGVYNSPKMFAFAKGAGVFGEAGPEAIMPLKRGADGSLGVQASMGMPAITVNLIESPGNGGQVNQRQDGNALTLDLMVEQIEGMMSKNVSKGRGIAPALERQYGLNRAAGAF